jgi:uncharacterized membrane protein
MKTFLVILLLIIIGVGIWLYKTGYILTKAVPDNTTTTITDTLVVVKDSLINVTVFDSVPSGFYLGMLPCKNCDGIQRSIIFSDDGNFKMEDLSWGKGTQAKKTEGTWEKEKGKFLLYLKDKVISKFKLVKDSLINTENNGVRIPDSLSKQYVLFKKNTAPLNPAWKKRKSEGIDIIGNGSDPTWSVEIDNSKLILFSLATAAKPVIVPIEKPMITKDSTVYSITTEGGSRLKISISSKFCSDGVSDHLYEYKMTVWYKDQMYKGCAVILEAAGEDE